MIRPFIANGFRLILVATLLGTAPAEAADHSAKELFGAVTSPVATTDGATHSIGSYAKGCLAGGVQLPADGDGWQAMRLSRDRRWGTPALVTYVETLASVVKADGWPGLLIGDMGQPRGGPMPSGHASHQIGLDVDIWLDPSPGSLSAKARETVSATSVLKSGTREVDPRRFTEAKRMLIYRAAQIPGVARIFVAPGIKRAMCAITWRDRSFLRTLRPWYGHDDHIHVRLDCPAGDTSCVPQAAAPAGDGCGDDLAWWFTDAPYKPSTSPPAPELTVADLPSQCAAVLDAR